MMSVEWTVRYMMRYPWKPEEGKDCWGLVREVLKEEAGIEVPPLSMTAVEAFKEDARSHEAFRNSHLAPSDWIEVLDGGLREFDIVVMGNFRRGGHHVGIVSPFLTIVHNLEKAGVVSQKRIDLAKTWNILHIYRHVKFS